MGIVEVVSAVETPVLAVTVYVGLVVVGIPAFMKNRAPLEVPLLLKAWNFLLFAYSVLTFACYTYVVVSAFLRGGLAGPVCDPAHDMWDTFAWSINFGFLVSKFAELGDTALLAVRKKPIIFLHWYHHVTVLLYSWYAYSNLVSNGIVFGWINSLIHSFMYYYYFAAANNRRLWWGSWLTLAQLGQMAIGIALTAMWAVYYYYLGMPCQSLNPFGSVLSASLMYMSYFYLFLVFYVSKTKGDKSM